MATFREKENYCRRTFDENGPYWHLYTSGKETPLMFRTEDDYVFAMNVIAQMAFEYHDIRILTFEIMGNHIHILAEGHSDRLLTAFTFLKKRLTRGMKESFPGGLPDGFSPTLKEVSDLEAMRNTIVYVNRNGFVSDCNVTPYSYPWGAGPYYFGHEPVTATTFHDITTKQGRNMFRGRIPDIPDSWPVADSFVLPVAYCSIKFAKAMFRDAHHYFSMLCRNLESYSGVAAEIDDQDYLTDGELFAQLVSIIRQHHHKTSLRELSKAQKLDLARTLHYDYRCSNGQLRRVIGLTQYEVDTLFPLKQSSDIGQ